MQLYPGYRHEDVLRMPSRLFHHLLWSRSRSAATAAASASPSGLAYSPTDIARMTAKHAPRLRAP